MKAQDEGSSDSETYNLSEESYAELQEDINRSCTFIENFIASRNSKYKNSEVFKALKSLHTLFKSEIDRGMMLRKAIIKNKNEKNRLKKEINALLNRVSGISSVEMTSIADIVNYISNLSKEKDDVSNKAKKENEDAILKLEKLEKKHYKLIDENESNKTLIQKLQNQIIKLQNKNSNNSENLERNKHLEEQNSKFIEEVRTLKSEIKRFISELQEKQDENNGLNSKINYLGSQLNEKTDEILKLNSQLSFLTMQIKEKQEIYDKKYSDYDELISKYNSSEQHNMILRNEINDLRSQNQVLQNHNQVLKSQQINMVPNTQLVNLQNQKTNLLQQMEQIKKEALQKDKEYELSKDQNLILAKEIEKIRNDYVLSQQALLKTKEDLKVAKIELEGEKANNLVIKKEEKEKLIAKLEEERAKSNGYQKQNELYFQQLQKITSEVSKFEESYSRVCEKFKKQASESKKKAADLQTELNERIDIDTKKIQELERDKNLLISSLKRLQSDPNVQKSNARFDIAFRDICNTLGVSYMTDPLEVARLVAKNNVNSGNISYDQSSFINEERKVVSLRPLMLTTMTCNRLLGMKANGTLSLLDEIKNVKDELEMTRKEIKSALY